MTNLWVLVCFLWSPNTEPDLAGYRLDWGTQSMHLLADRTNACVSVPRGTTNTFYLVALFEDGTESIPAATLTHGTEPPMVQVHLQSSDDLMTWETVASVTVPLVATNAQRFYRGLAEVR